MIVVDAGHGGTDPGGSGNGIVERDYTLRISNYMLNRFKELGQQVKATRTTDETVSPEERVRRILNAFGNKSDVVVLSNHLNIGGGDGAEVVYALRDADTLSKLILEELANVGQNTRKWYQRRLPSNPSKDYYFIHRDTGVTEPVLIEYGFMDNTTDANFIKNNWQRMAEAVVKAVAEYKKIPYRSPGGTAPTTPSGGTYIVKSGDSLYSVAKKYAVGVDALKSANNLTSNMLTVGQVLKIPGFVPNEGANITYVVKSGDSLYSIASKYNTTVDKLKDLNNLTSNTLSVGQVLKIPSTITPQTGESYTVQKGDSLWSVANKFDVSVTELKNLNNLTSDILNVGQVLVIPGVESTGPAPDTYTVQKGDSLYTIAIKFNTTVDELKRLNNLTSNTLSIGQVLELPSSRFEDIYTPFSFNYDNAFSQEQNKLENPSFITTPYTVKYGDTLWNIANLYNVTVNAIREENNLMTDLLTVGQVLLIPANNLPYNIYTVQPGDSLWVISKKFNMTVDDLRRINGLTSDLILVGQQLKISL